MTPRLSRVLEDHGAVPGLADLEPTVYSVFLILVTIPIKD
jgi:hypothetical protein